MAVSQIEFTNRINVSSINIIPDNYLFKSYAANVLAGNADEKRWKKVECLSYPFVREREHANAWDTR